jgi:formylglycine-generating enzyme required for sulfatase activity
MAPSLLQQVLQGLAEAVPEPPDSLTLAEALWLAPLLLQVEPDSGPDPQPPGPAAERLKPDPDPDDTIPGGLSSDAEAQPGGRQDGPDPADHAESDDQAEEPAENRERSTPSTTNAAASLLPREALPRAADVDALRQLLPVWLEDPPLLADSLALLRALVPLQAQQVAGPRLRLDEQATVEAYVASCGPDGAGGCWRPVLVPIPEPRYDLVLVIDGALSMALWQRLVLDLQRALASCAVVRQLRLVRLDSEGCVPPRQRRWCQSDPEGRRLLLVLSDCCGDAWWSGAMAEQLTAWGDAASLAVLQVLPSWMWPRTALGQGDERVLRNVGSAAAVRLRADRQRWLSPLPPWLSTSTTAPGPRCATIAVLRCDPEALAAWSLMLTATPGQVCPGVVLPTPEALALEGTPAVEEPAAADGAPSGTDAGDPELERLAEFEAMATPRARRLLQLLAAAPVLTLPVIRLIRQALLWGDRTPLATAEVLLGGVLQLHEPRAEGESSGSASEFWQFTMAPQVRAQLLSTVDDLDAVTVLNAVTRLVEERWNQFMPQGSFRAFLTDPFQQAPPQLAGIEGFASVAADVLDQLGGEYAALARQLRDGARRQVEEPWPGDEFCFEEAEFDTGRLLPDRFPPLQILSVQMAEWRQIELQALTFTTATLQPAGGFGLRALTRGRRQPTISTSQASGWGCRQRLDEGAENPGLEALALTLVQIPAGRFLMGSPPDEPERLDNEGPQHEVELESFFMGQTPITQAQWREVAGWQERPGESWGRELKPNPSSFKSRDDRGKAGLLAGEFSTDDCPVERVSWDDAIEFCNRLSQRTGRTYTLPSEAQWEYACRAGTSTPFHFGETMTTELANYNGRYPYPNGPKGECRDQTTPVGMFPANAWGLQDMPGNVWEWCQDHWHGTYVGAPVDGSAWLDDEGLNAAKDSKKERLLRGGSWIDIPRYCRSAFRNHDQPDDASFNVGFRVVCLPQGPSLNP